MISKSSTVVIEPVQLADDPQPAIPSEVSKYIFFQIQLFLSMVQNCADKALISLPVTSEVEVVGNSYSEAGQVLPLPFKLSKWESLSMALNDPRKL